MTFAACVAAGEKLPPRIETPTPGGKTAATQMSRSLSNSTLSCLIDPVPFTAAQCMVPSNRQKEKEEEEEKCSEYSSIPEDTEETEEEAEKEESCSEVSTLRWVESKLYKCGLT